MMTTGKLAEMADDSREFAAADGLRLFDCGSDQLLDRLEQAGQLTRAELSKVRLLLQSEHTDMTVMQLLLKLGLLSESELLHFLSREMRLKILPRESYPRARCGDSMFNRKFLERFRMLVVSKTEQFVEICINDPFIPGMGSVLSFAMGHRLLKVRLGFSRDIEEVHGLIMNDEAQAAATRYEEQDAVLLEQDIRQLKELASEAPVIKLVNSLIHDAIKNNASDIHIEPQSDSIKLRNRIDGVLVPVQDIPLGLIAAIVSRIKILSELDIAQRRQPQDGRFDMNIDGQDVDIRVSILPTIHGESVVLRLLYKKSIRFDFDSLGYSPENRDRILSVLEKPHGLVLVTGPTGSGKSTTLYAMMQQLNSSERKIMSVEDPVEYKIDGINQIQVNPDVGVDFSGALRAIVRHDPEVIMVGEMRDSETAEIAIRASMTGHLMLTTLHTNSAVSSIERLLDLGVDRAFVFSSLIAVVAQRLVRRLCDRCKQPVSVEQLCIDNGRFEQVPLDAYRVHRAIGCDACNHTGYRGRVSISEVMMVDDDFRASAMKGDETIDHIARRHGLGSMIEDGFRKVIQGETSMDELFRVVMQ